MYNQILGIFFSGKKCLTPPSGRILDPLGGFWTLWSEVVGARRRRAKALRRRAPPVRSCAVRFSDARQAQVGSADKEARKCKKPELLHFQAHGVLPKHEVHEFRVSEDAMLPSGAVLNARHFVPGQYVDVTGISIGKGFQGAMKRWGFKGQSATHGNSKSHRSLGSTGHRKTPGRTWKGKKMHGHMGCDQITTMGLMVYGIDVHPTLPRRFQSCCSQLSIPLMQLDLTRLDLLYGMLILDFVAGRYPAVCCSVLQYVALCCSMLQYVTLCCSLLQCAAVYCSVLQCAAVPLCAAVC